MRKYLGLALSLALFTFASIGQAWATGSFGIDSNCPDGDYPVNCGPIVITVTSLNGFAGTVNLSPSVSPSCSPGYCLNVTLNPTSVNVPAGGKATSNALFTHSCNFSVNVHCLWTVTVTGTNPNAPTNSTAFAVCYGRVCPI